MESLMEGREIIWCGGGGGELKGRSDLAQSCKKTPEPYCCHDSLASADKLLVFYNISPQSSVKAGNIWLLTQGNTAYLPRISSQRNYACP